MVNSDVPGGGPGQGSTSIVGAGTQEQSSDPAARGGQVIEPVSAHGGAVSTTAHAETAPGLYSEKIQTALKALINGSYPSGGRGLLDTRVGAQILLNWLQRDTWVLDRTESFAISAEAWAPRSFTADLDVQDLPAVEDASYFLPLQDFPLNDVREVMAHDENGMSLPTLAPVEQTHAVGSMLVALASIIVNNSVLLTDSHEISEALRAAASAMDKELKQDHFSGVQDKERLDALLRSPAFRELTDILLGREFVCVRTGWRGRDNNRRHVVRFNYQQAARSGLQPPGGQGWLRRTAAQLGIRVTVLDIDLPDSRGAGHWRFNVTVPEGAELQAHQLIEGYTGDGEKQLVAGAGQIDPACSSKDGYKILRVEFTISRQWRTWVLTNALLIALLLAVGAWRIGFVAENQAELDTRDLTAAFILGINGAFAGILARPTGDALASKFLSGIRTAISVLGMLAFVAVASLAFGPSGHALFILWLVLASVAGFVFLLVFLGSGLWESRQAERLRSVGRQLRMVIRRPRRTQPVSGAESPVAVAGRTENEADEAASGLVPRAQ
jgi:hypothetical protein